MALVSLYGLYVATINVFLSTSLFDRTINSIDAEMLQIHYERGWSLVPGRIHARNLSIRASDSNVEWLLTLDEVEFDMSFVGLTKTRFDVSRARGHGITFRARQKLDAAPNELADVAHLPQIPGFPAFAVRPAGPPSLERWFDEHFALWTVRLEDTVAEDVREVWIDGGRFQGNARIAGRFYLKPIRAVDVGPCHVDVREGAVTLGPTLPIAKRVSGTIDMAINRFDPRAVPERTIFRHLTVATELTGALADVEHVPLPFPEGLSVASEVDVPRLAVKIEHGVVAAGTRVELRTERWRVAKNDVIAFGAFDATADVTEQGLHGALALHGPSVVGPDGTTIATAPDLALAVDSRDLDLVGKPLHDARFDATLPAATIPDVARLAALLPKDIPLPSGAAHARAHAVASLADERFSVEGHAEGPRLTRTMGRAHAAAAAWDADARVHVVGDVADASVEARAKELRVERGDQAARGAIAAKARIRAGLSAKHRVPVRVDDASLVLSDVAITRGGASLATLARATVHGDRVTVHDGVAAGRVLVALQRAGVRTDTLTAFADAEASIAITRLDLDRKRLTLGQSHLAVTGVEGQLGGDMAIRGAYGLYDREREGAFVVEKGPFSVGLHLDEEGAKPRFFDLDPWLRGHTEKVKARIRNAAQR